MNNEELRYDRLWFSHQLRKVLGALYDPVLLRQSPLIEAFDLAQRRDPVAALRQILLEGIEALKPAASTPHQSKMWRTYHILQRRYVEQVPQRGVAHDFGLSTRQLQREESDARDALLYHLWNTYQLEAVVGALPQIESDGLTDVPTLAQELEWLRETIPAQTTNVNELLRQALMMLQPVLDASVIQVITDLDEDLPYMRLRAPLLLQALLNLLGAMVQSTAQGAVHVLSRTSLSNVEIYLRTDIQDELREDFDYELTEHMIELCQGRLTLFTGTSPSGQLEAVISLAMDRPFTVLIVDDNADTQQLYQRYLTGSSYNYLGATTFEDGLAIANESAPHVIVLDVMMPQNDGWTVLGQLRYQPATSHIPVIVCTILGQEELALALGAADFLRKPVNRSTFLSALNRQVGLLATDDG